MPSIDPNESMYVNAEVLWATGLNLATLQTWVNRGLVDVEDRNPGQGERRLYSPIAVIRLAIMAKLTRNGTPPSVASDMCRNIDPEDITAAMQVADQPMYMLCRRLSGGGLISQIGSDMTQLEKAVAPDVDETYTLINLRGIVRYVRRQLDGIEAARRKGLIDAV